MKINWKVRFKNKVWLGSFLSLIVSFVYSMLSMFDVFPEVTKNSLLELLNRVLTFLGLIGVIVDLTTAGLGDSERAMGYGEGNVFFSPYEFLIGLELQQRCKWLNPF